MPEYTKGGRRKRLDDPVGVYRKIFKDEYGDGPYSCDYCGGDCYWPDVVVHHRDHDHFNHAPSNLGAMHEDCHNKHHHVGMHHTDEARQQMSDGHLARTTQPEYVHNRTGMKQTPEAIAKARATKEANGTLRPTHWIGRTHAEESKQKMSASQTGKKHSAETRKKMSESRKRYYELRRQAKDGGDAND